MKEGAISHEEVNAAIAAAGKTLLFGSQNRLREGLRVGDQPLRRVRVAHDQVRFFYAAVRQLPEFFLDALLASNITVTLVMGCDLLCFKDIRNHQAIHTGLARRTIYLPEGLLAAVYNNGYDYWSLTQILITEGWKLLDYALLVTLVQEGLRRLLTHHTGMGYATFRRTLGEKNRHRSAYESPTLREKQRRSGQQLPINELEEFIEVYEKGFLRLLRPGAKGKLISADELARDLFNEYQEELWAARKVAELAEEFQFPTLFLLDRDVVHSVARQRAEKVGQDPSPQCIEDARHDFRDALRFGRNAEVATETLVQAAARFGPQGIEGLLQEVCAGLFSDRPADQGLEERVWKMLNALSTGLIRLENPLALVRCGEVLRFYGQVSSGERRLHLEDLEWIRALLISLAATKASAGDTTQAQIISAIEKVEELFAQFRVLLAREAGRLLGRAVSVEEIGSPGILAQLDAATHSAMAGITRSLDRPANYQKTVLEQYGPTPAVGAHTRMPTVDAEPAPAKGVFDQVGQILGLLPAPARLYACTSGSAMALRRSLRRFELLRARHPTDPEQLAWLAMVMVRLDRAANYERLLDQVRALGNQAVGQRLEVKERSASGRIVNKIVYQPGLLWVIDEDGWEGSDVARRAAALARELAGEEVLSPIRKAPKTSGKG